MKLETSSSVAIPVEPKAGSKSISQNQGFRRSRTDLNDRYVPQTVILKKASLIDDVELSGLKPSAPCRSKPKKQLANVDQVSSITPKKKSGKKKLLKEPTRKEGPKALKKSFKSVFATIILTTGSLEGCLGRATTLSKPKIEQLVQQIGLEVSTVNSAKHLVYKLIEMRILRPLLNTVPENQENRLDMDFLDKILNSDWVERSIQNLMSFVLRNSTASQGPLNASDLALSNIIAELASKVSLDLKFHYRRLTETLETKLTKLSMDCRGLPTTGQDGTEAGVDAAAADMDEDVDDSDNDNDNAIKLSKNITFEPGHIQLCWRYFLQLPPSKQPRFCVQAKMGDSFMNINEEALVALL
ncbi:hypothetical protein FBU30_002003 [Linnemannia zychae]|nr:hypothetical protein FBU30_002003 [Linnemannia zychae]